MAHLGVLTKIHQIKFRQINLISSSDKLNSAKLNSAKFNIFCEGHHFGPKWQNFVIFQPRCHIFYIGVSWISFWPNTEKRNFGIETKTISAETEFLAKIKWQNRCENGLLRFLFIVWYERGEMQSEKKTWERCEKRCEKRSWRKVRKTMLKNGAKNIVEKRPPTGVPKWPRKTMRKKNGAKTSGKHNEWKTHFSTPFF